MAVFFNGRLLTTPTVATRIDDSAMANKNLTVENNLAIIGQSVGGIPQTVIKLGNPQEAAEYFTSGELVDAIKKAFAPSAETNAPQAVYAVRVDPATQSHFVLAEAGTPEDVTLGVLTEVAKQIVLVTGVVGNVDDYYAGWRIKMLTGAAAGETNLITGFDYDTLTCDLRYDWKNDPSGGDTAELIPAALCLESTDYGSQTTRVKVKVAAGTTAGTKYVATSFDDTEYIADNLGENYFTLDYTGVAASALVTVTASAITVKAGVLAAEVEIASCDLAVYDTVSKVSDYFDSLPDLDAAYDPSCRDYPTYGKLDFVTDVSIDGTSPTNITANLQAIVDWLGGLSESFIDVYRPVTSGVVPDNIGYTALYGGTSTTPLTTDWQACFDVLQVEDVQCIVPLSSAAAVHAMAVAHCSYMSNAGAMERRCIVGGAIGETAAEVILRAYNLNHDRCYIVTPGYKDYNAEGVLTEYAPYMFAALLGGMITGSDPGTSLTNKTVSINGLIQKYRSPTDTDEFIKAGVMVAVESREGYKMVQSCSTWLANDNYNRVEMGTGFATDYVARNVRNALGCLIGQKATPIILGRAVSIVESTCKELARTAPLGPEVITGDEANPAYKNITATLEGDVLRVSFQCSPVVPVNYIPVGISIVPYSGSAAI
jgi:hypothetical protein